MDNSESESITTQQTRRDGWYDQAYIDMLDIEIKHYQRLYRKELKRRLELEWRLRQYEA